jgi:hypothetical protein
VGPRAVLDAVVKRKIPSPRSSFTYFYSSSSNIVLRVRSEVVSSRYGSVSVMTRLRAGLPGFE